MKAARANELTFSEIPVTTTRTSMSTLTTPQQRSPRPGAKSYTADHITKPWVPQKDGGLAFLREDITRGGVCLARWGWDDTYREKNVAGDALIAATLQLDEQFLAAMVERLFGISVGGYRSPSSINATGLEMTGACIWNTFRPIEIGGHRKTMHGWLMEANSRYADELTHQRNRRHLLSLID